MTPHLEHRFRKAYPSVCQIVLRRLVEWKWGRVIPFAHLCAGLAYYPRRCSFARVSGFIRAYIPAIYTRLGHIAGLQVLLMMAGSVDDDEKKALFLLPNIWTPSLPWLVVGLGFLVSDVTRPGLSLWANIPGLYSGLPLWLWIHRLKWALFLLPILW